MAEQEGVVKYRLWYKPEKAVETPQIHQINDWRSILFRLNLIGQDPDRYDGFGFGNISQRISPCQGNSSEDIQFIITGTQTGGLSELRSEHYSTVTGFNLSENSITAVGSIKPSSEALTHAAVYAANSDICYVFHIHSPEIWQNAKNLGLPVITADIPYGTVEMARAVVNLLTERKTKEISIFSMLGHEDGIVSFGSTANEAGITLMNCLARALVAG